MDSPEELLSDILALKQAMDRMEDFWPTAGRALLLAALTAWAVLSFTGVTTFIYSNYFPHS